MCILGFNSEEWMVANLGAITANMVTSGIYLTNSTPLPGASLWDTYYITDNLRIESWNNVSLG